MNLDDITPTAPEWDTLWVLFGAYLNQDFNEDYGDPWNAVRAFKSEAGASRSREAADASRTLLAHLRDENQAERVTERLGLAYYPPDDGYTYNGWLGELAAFLEAGDRSGHPEPGSGG